MMCFKGLKSDSLKTWNLLPNQPDWGSDIIAGYRPGEAGAMSRLTTFLARNFQTFTASCFWRNIAAPNLDCGKAEPL